MLILVSRGSATSSFLKQYVFLQSFRVLLKNDVLDDFCLHKIVPREENDFVKFFPFIFQISLAI